MFKFSVFIKPGDGMLTCGCIEFVVFVALANILTIFGESFSWCCNVSWSWLVLDGVVWLLFSAFSLLLKNTCALFSGVVLIELFSTLLLVIDVFD